MCRELGPFAHTVSPLPQVLSAFFKKCLPCPWPFCASLPTSAPLQLWKLGYVIASGRNFKQRQTTQRPGDWNAPLAERLKDLPKPWNHVTKKSVTNDPIELNMGLCIGMCLWIEAQTSRNWATERQEQVPRESQKIFFSSASELPAERGRDQCYTRGIKTSPHIWSIFAWFGLCLPDTSPGQ